ncbi:hypothetical protein OC834_006909 [Tilletia horrida]|nr:hypothetical protein OC834_006909 [Tilletia horrida]KAK0524491.1 hypothetical protein OC835_005904 [Tilletia horrida]
MGSLVTANSIFSMGETGVQPSTNSKSFKFATSSKPRSETVTAKEGRAQVTLYARDAQAGAGISDFPEAMFTRPRLAEAEAKELEDDTFGNGRLAESLSDMVPQA